MNPNEWVELQAKRIRLKLNPICPVCGRVMRTKTKNKYSAEYYCVCNPKLTLNVG